MLPADGGLGGLFSVQFLHLGLGNCGSVVSVGLSSLGEAEEEVRQMDCSSLCCSWPWDCKL